MARNRNGGIALGALLRRAGPGTSIRVYGDKEVIYSQDHSADAIFYIQSGIVKLTVGTGRARRRAVLAILPNGAVFGEGCLLPTRGARRMSTATSIGSSTIVRVKKAVFLARLEREPVLAVLLIRTPDLSSCPLADRLSGSPAEFFRRTTAGAGALGIQQDCAEIEERTLNASVEPNHSCGTRWHQSHKSEPVHE